MSFWASTFRSLVRTRFGLWVLLLEALVLAIILVALWYTGRSESLDVAVALQSADLAPVADLILTFFVALPIAVLAVYLLPAMILMVGASVLEVSRAFLRRGTDW